ncbi:MAG TPA: hypothetical protein DCS44_09165 [Cyanobacteria bacterium UBA10660]|nr:MAG TPA: hypothetical protein CPT83_03920 [Candidatus Gastranaerophilales bacterium HUM_1]HAS94761.1 hypothetical protein [Cyanobacteria bacterium UBA10660]
MSQTIRLSDQTPYTVKEVIIQNKKWKVRGKITTFLDKEGNVIEKAFNIKDKPLKNRIYTSQKNHIGSDEVVISTQIKEYTLKRNLIDIYRKHIKDFIKWNVQTSLWEQEKIQTNHVAKHIPTDIINLTISRIQNLKNLKQEYLHSFTQYKPIVNNKISKNSPIKYIEYIVNDKFIALKSSIHTINMKRPKFDSFLGFRALSLEDFKIPITERFLCDRGIKHLGYKILPNYMPTDGKEITWKGLFCNGYIKFRRTWVPKSKADFVSTSRHEVEHGWQYYLDARNGQDRGDNMLAIGEKYGKLKDPKLQYEADKYTESIDNYIPAEKDYNGYRQNYIEVKAFDAGARAEEKYKKEGRILKEELKHIPTELL